MLKACIAANKIIIMQAANPGFTGGSTPKGNDYDRYRYRLFDQTSRLNEGDACATLSSIEWVLRPVCANERHPS